MSKAALKKQQVPLICYFRLYGADKAALLSVSGKRRGAHNAIALAGTMAEIARLKAAASPVTPKVAKAIASYRKVTGRDDVDLILAAEMRAHIQREIASTAA